MEELTASENTNSISAGLKEPNCLLTAGPPLVLERACRQTSSLVEVLLLLSNTRRMFQTRFSGAKSPLTFWMLLRLFSVQANC